MARLKTNIDYLNDMENLGAANENDLGPHHQQSQGADAIARSRQSNPAPALSESEAEVLQSIIVGKQSSQIAAETDGGALAMKEHLRSVLRKVRGY